jgi:hypothetical protein
MEWGESLGWDERKVKRRNLRQSFDRANSGHATQLGNRFGLPPPRLGPSMGVMSMRENCGRVLSGSKDWLHLGGILLSIFVPHRRSFSLGSRLVLALLGYEFYKFQVFEEQEGASCLPSAEAMKFLTHSGCSAIILSTIAIASLTERQ